MVVVNKLVPLRYHWMLKCLLHVEFVWILKYIINYIDVSVILLMSEWLNVLDGDSLWAGLHGAKSGEGCFITKGTLSKDWLFVLKWLSEGVEGDRGYGNSGGLLTIRRSLSWLLNISSLIGRGPGWLRELRKLCKLWKLCILRFSSRSSNVLLNALTTRSCQ